VCKKIPYLACSPVTLRSWTTKQVCDGTKRYIPDGPVRVRLCHENAGKKAVDCPLTHNLERPLKPPQELYTALGEIKRYLDRNRRAIVTIFFESYVDDRNMMADQFNASGISHYIFNPDSHGVGQKGWPTIGWMRAQNKRVVVLSSNHSKDGLPNSWAYVVETQYDLAKHNNCAIRGDTTDNVKNKNVTLLTMNHFYGIMAGQPWVPVGNLTPTAINNYVWLQKRAKQCWNAVKRVPNFIALDFAE